MDGRCGSVVAADGTRIGFLTGGAGPALLLVHGGMCSSARWGPLWPWLTDRFEVTAMDRRGRGSSGDAGHYALEAEYGDVTAVAEHLAARQGQPVDLFGHSYGAVCALGAAARGAPVRRLALYEPPGRQTVPAQWLDRMRLLVDQGQLGRAMYSFLLDVVGLSPEAVEALRDSPGGADPMPILQRTLVREAEALRMVDLPALAAAVGQPALLLLGSASPPWAADVSRSLLGAMPAARIAVLADVGHEGVDDAPDVVAGHLSRFLRGTDDRS